MNARESAQLTGLYGRIKEPLLEILDKYKVGNTSIHPDQAPLVRNPAALEAEAQQLRQQVQTSYAINRRTFGQDIPGIYGDLATQKFHQAEALKAADKSLNNAWLLVGEISYKHLTGHKRFQTYPRAADVKTDMLQSIDHAIQSQLHQQSPEGVKFLQSVRRQIEFSPDSGSARKFAKSLQPILDKQLQRAHQIFTDWGTNATLIQGQATREHASDLRAAEIKNSLERIDSLTAAAKETRDLWAGNIRHEVAYDADFAKLLGNDSTITNAALTQTPDAYVDQIIARTSEAMHVSQSLDSQRLPRDTGFSIN